MPSLQLVLLRGHDNGIYISTKCQPAMCQPDLTKLTINVTGIATTNFGRITLAIAPIHNRGLNTTTIYAAGR